MKQWYAFIPVFFLIISFLLCGCAPAGVDFGKGQEVNFETPAGSQRDKGGDGQAPVVVSSVFPAGQAKLCTQGAHSPPTHQYNSTREDIDLDTSNHADELIYAPVSGTVYTQIASDGFGLHLNIERADGTYVVIGHLEEVLVSDGARVEQGQLIAIEGCSGNCTGDHVHLGLHEGEAGEDASNGRSIPVRFDLDDVSAGIEGPFLGSEMVCGIKAAGDPHDGHQYRSKLKVNLWHPNGTLVKVPTDPRVYLIEEGARRWITHEEVFWSHRYAFDDVVLVGHEELACYREGLPIESATQIRAGLIGAEAWLFLGTSSEPGRHRRRVKDVALSSVLASWGIRVTDKGDLSRINAADAANYPAHEADAGFRDGTILKEANKADVYVVADGRARPVFDWETYVLMGYHDREILLLAPGELAAVQGEPEDCEVNGACLTRERAKRCGGSLSHGPPDQGGVDEGEEPAPEDPLEDEVEETPEQTPEEPTSEEPVQDPPEEESSRVLHLSYRAPSLVPIVRTTLSGEYVRANGDLGFTWRELVSQPQSQLDFTLEGVETDDTFRFSVEFEDAQGNVSWGCIGTPPRTQAQGTTQVDVDGIPVAIWTAGDPRGEGGCGFIVRVL